MKDNHNYIWAVIVGIIWTGIGIWLKDGFNIWCGGVILGAAVVAIDRKYKINEGKDI